ncbi:MBOAT family protein [Neiella marina]|uniref:Probable alginate O-acetylase n=1 Tax=Neiella holothuriorum TaxID=2870530 RepID=A0ABS7EH22_9GAMM|nr:MBOAT family O-acyltransferase [Neiella holothuriorum]MBW8191637.1 MBOAT family protein [Neiella holothuriorum]
MLFPSVEFIFVFLPLTLLFIWLGTKSGKVSLVNCLLFTSLIFYVLPNLEHAYIIVGSILVNYFLSSKIQSGSDTTSFRLMWLGIIFNLAIITYFKYMYFFGGIYNGLTGNDISFDKLVLPVGISFYTFQQIAYLVDSYKYRDAQYKLNEYSLFVCFFPQLIAGPIVHHKEIMPQISNLLNRKIDPHLISIGVIFFIIGLFKKILLADNFALIANPIFTAAEPESIDTLTAWIGALAYTFQLYFDFSAYSEMAIGLGLILGIKLPVNFNSPYKAANIIDFWRRWHMTLSRFLRDYLYIALGGNRKGESRRYINLMLTMLIGGLWHGAGWGFIIWGGLHGFYLLVNHAMQHYLPGVRLHRMVGVILTFLAVVFAWVYFRAEELSTANTIVLSMLGQSSALMQSFELNQLLHITFLLIGFFCIWALPNFGKWIGYTGVECNLETIKFNTDQLLKSPLMVVVVSLMVALSMAFLPEPSVFIYFNF